MRRKGSLLVRGSSTAFFLTACLIFELSQYLSCLSPCPACSIDDPTTLQSWIEPKAPTTSPLPRLLMITPAINKPDLQRRIHFHGIESAAPGHPKNTYPAGTSSASNHIYYIDSVLVSRRHGSFNRRISVVSVA
jgi:hypothetical protein